MRTYWPELHVSRPESLPSFLMVVTLMRIEKGCATHGVCVQPGSSPALHYLWRLLFEYMGKAIRYLNQAIAAEATPRFVLYRVIDLLSIEVRRRDSPHLFCNSLQEGEND